MARKKSSKRKVSDCRQKTPEGRCPGKYRLTYEDNAPIFTCDKCGDKDLTWQKFYNEYLQLFRGKENWDIKKHQVSCIIGFFCYKYKEFYDTDYVFVPKNPNPYGAKECRDAWSLLAVFNGSAHEVRKYIHWLFKKRINKNAKIISFGYITTPAFIRQYKLYASKKHVLTRASKLPSSFIRWCQDNTPNIFDNYALETMNDLGALLSYVKHYNEDIPEDGIERQVIEQARGLSLIKENKLNIGE